MTRAIIAPRGLADRLTALFWRRPNLLLALLIAPPLLWLGVVYLGSLAALLLQSFYAIDEFSGLVVREFTLKTYGELLRPSNADVILRTLAMAIAVTLASAVLAFPVAYFAARYARGRWKAAFYLGIMLPLWSSYLVKVYAWKLILAKEGILTWAAEATHTIVVPRRRPVAAGRRRQLALHLLHRHLPGLHLCLAALHDPADAGGAGTRADLDARGVRRPWRHRAPDLPHA